MVVRIVKEQDVKPVEPRPLVALLNRRHDPVVGEVPDRSNRRNVLVERFAEVELALIPWRISPEQPSNLGGNDNIVPRESGYRSAHALLGEAVAIERRCIKIPKAVGDGTCEGRVGMFV
jgi:hypothetical protein